VNTMLGEKQRFPGISSHPFASRFHLRAIGSASTQTLARLSPRIITETGYEDEKVESHNSVWSENGDEEWTEAKNQRRCDLINRQYAGGLTLVETTELDHLQEEMLRYRKRVAPLPIEAARRLYQKLLAEVNGSQSPIDS
jgi:hypothetical protein